jgi:hypothetical protein
MDRDRLNRVFRTAATFHKAVARYARAMRAGGDVEDAAQQVVGASLRYRLALDGLQTAASPSRVQGVRKVLGCTSRQYNAVMRIQASRRSNPRRTVS